MIHPGLQVGARRWPYYPGHPDGWGRPWAGVVLAVDSPEAWAGTLAFGSASPDPEAVRAHVARVQAEGGLRSHVPVRWDFGYARVWWERAADLRPYAVDLAEWTAERRDAWDEAAIPRASKQLLALTGKGN
jgi:hypothetical protein